MKHLVLGAGRMGQKHGDILTEMGEDVDFFDPPKGFDRLTCRKNKYDSYLVCTPPETHRDIIEEISSYHRPIFCEKPVLCDPRPLPGLSEPTLGACNWRWSDLMDMGLHTLLWSYTYDTPHKYLDLVHGLDLMWVKYGKPPQAKLVIRDGSHYLMLYYKDGPRTVQVNNPGKAIRTVNREPMRYSDEMFYEQMRHWLDVVSGKAKSVNPLEQAEGVTRWLINLKNATYPGN